MNEIKTTDRGHGSSESIFDRLRRTPYRFEFFQAIRLLQQSAVKQTDPSKSLPQLIGRDSSPDEEVVRIRAHRSLGFPQQELHDFRDPSEGPPEVDISFLGLTGPSGVLPHHYSQLVVERTRHGDFSLSDFLDIFNHRFASFFYRAWAKHRLPVMFEEGSGQRNPRQEDLYTRCLYCFIGLGSEGIRRRQHVLDSTQIFYGGLFANRTRCAISLEQMASDYLGWDVRVRQFHGQWLTLTEPDQSCFSSNGFGRELNNQLGTSVIAGRRVWSVENRFLLRIGPLSLSEFSHMTPDGQRLHAAAQLVRSYVGSEFDFAFQLVLRRDEVPVTQLNGSARLGWNTWIANRPFIEDQDDATFAMEGGPNDHQG